MLAEIYEASVSLLKVLCLLTLFAFSSVNAGLLFDVSKITLFSFVNFGQCATEISNALTLRTLLFSRVPLSWYLAKACFRNLARNLLVVGLVVSLSGQLVNTQAII